MHVLVSLIVAALLLGGCSAIRTVYNQAEHVAAWRADDYFDLNGEQKQQFRSAFAGLHAWHRATQLGAYAELLEAIDRRLARGPAQRDVAWALDGVRARAHALVQQGYRDAAAFLSTLSDAQLDAARRRFERDNREFAREHGLGATAEEQKRLRAKEDLKTIEQWAGPLDANQRAQFIRLSESQPLVAELRLRDRMRRQREFLDLLAQRHGPAFSERLRDWLLDWNAGRPAELGARLEAFHRARSGMLLAVFEQLRPEQQRRVSEQLRGYIDAMRDLSREARRHAETGRLDPRATP